MSDQEYIKQLEEQNEQLQQKCARNYLTWAVHKHDPDRYFIFFHRCLLAQIFKSDLERYKHWRVCIYSSVGSTDRTEDGGTFVTLEEAKEAALKIIYSARDFGEEIP